MLPKKKTNISYVIREESEPLHKNGVNAIVVAKSPASCLFTASRDSIIRSWDTSSKVIKLINTYEHHNDWVNSIFYVPKHDLLFSGSSDTSVKIWDASKGFVMSSLRTHRDYVKKLAYAYDQDVFASGGLDKKIYVWDVCTLKCLTTSHNTVTTNLCEGHKDSIYSLEITPNSNLLVAGGTECFLRLWDPRTSTKIAKLKGHTDNVKALKLSQDGTMLLSGSSDGTVKLWSIGQQRCVITYRYHTEGVWALATNSDFSKFYSGGREGLLFETDLKTYESDLLIKEAAPILDIFCEDDRYLWVGTTNTAVNKWEIPRTGPATKSSCNGPPQSNGLDPCPRVTRRAATIPGGKGLKKVYTLSDKQHVICTNEDNEGFMYNVLHARLIKELGKIDIKEELAAYNKPEYVPNWFTADVKTGMLSIHLDENDCYAAWVCAKDEGGINDSKINYGGFVIHGLLKNWATSSRSNGDDSGNEARELTNKQFKIPYHTPFALIEGSDGCGRTLFRIRVDETDNPNDSRILDDLIPNWVYNIKVKNEMPKFTKIAFYIEPYTSDPTPKSREGRLSANDFLSISKVIEYVEDKILRPQESNNPLPHEISIYCNKTKLLPTMDLRTVKHTIWKSGADLRLMYMINSSTA